MSPDPTVTEAPAAVETPTRNTIVAEALRTLADLIQTSGTPLPQRLTLNGFLTTEAEVRSAAALLGARYHSLPHEGTVQHYAALVTNQIVNLEFAAIVKPDPDEVAAALAMYRANKAAEADAAQILANALAAAPTATTQAYAEATRDALANALLALDLHEHAAAVLVDGAEFNTYWVEIRTTDEAELCRLFVNNGVWWVGGEVTGRLSSSDGPQEFAAFVAERLAEVMAEDGMPEPCQPIGCDNGYHRPGCTFAAVDEPVPSAPRIWSAGQAVDADVLAVADSDACDPGTWHRVVGKTWQFHRAGSSVQLGVVDEARMLSEYGPVTEVLAVAGDVQSAVQA